MRSAPDCRGAFGLGSVCGEAGLCESVKLDERCKDVYPEDLFTAPEKYPNAVILGSLLDHNKVSGDLLMVNAATLAVQGANSSGLNDGRLFGIVHCDYQEFPVDSKTSEEAAIDGAKYLVDELGAVAIIGPGTSSLAEVGVSRAAKAGARAPGPHRLAVGDERQPHRYRRARRRQAGPVLAHARRPTRRSAPSSRGA